jgi:hypothetical protein
MLSRITVHLKRAGDTGAHLTLGVDLPPLRPIGMIVASGVAGWVTYTELGVGAGITSAVATYASLNQVGK